MPYNLYIGLTKAYLYVFSNIENNRQNPAKRNYCSFQPFFTLCPVK